jgi:putative heme-binding domain-containing protein
VKDVLPRLVAKVDGTDEQSIAFLGRLLMHMDPAAAADPAVAARIAAVAGATAGSRQFIAIVRRFGLERRLGADLIAMASAAGQNDQLAADAAAAAMQGGTDQVRAAVAMGDAAAGRLAIAIGIRGSKEAIGILGEILATATVAPEMQVAAVRGMGRSPGGARELVALAKAGGLTGALPQVAAQVIGACPWADVRQAAAAVLPMPQTRGGEPLPAFGELVNRPGNPTAGKAVFAGVGTCAKCHVVDGVGKAVGPDLSGIGAKLSRGAIFEAILAPSAGISHGYEQFLAVLEDGRALPGLVISKTPEQVVIRGADGIDVTVPAAEIEELRRQPLSLMPADLAATLSVQELVDLVTWLETLRATR